MFLMNLSAANKPLGVQDGRRGQIFHLHYLLDQTFMRSETRLVRNLHHCSIHGSVTWLPTSFVSWNDGSPSLLDQMSRVLEVLQVVCAVVRLEETGR